MKRSSGRVFRAGSPAATAGTFTRLLVGLAIVLSLPLAGSRAEAESGSVVEVIDGDTLKVTLGGGTRTIRLLGVDTPELGRPDRTAEFLAKEARAYTRGLVQGEPVRLEADPEGDTVDRFGRALRYVYLPDGRLLNALLVSEGYAVAFTRFPFSRLDEFRELERVAREAGKGLWSPGAMPTLEPEHAAAHVGSTATVCGEVAASKYADRSNGRPTFLNLGAAYPDQLLTIVIWGSDRHRFDAPESVFNGKTVCVTGKIRSHKGKPEIIVRDPSQIEVVAR